MKDASGHEHDEKGLFTGPGGGAGNGTDHSLEVLKKQAWESMPGAKTPAARKAFHDAQTDMIAGQKRGWSKEENDKAYKRWDLARRKLLKASQDDNQEWLRRNPIKREPHKSNIKESDLIPHPALKKQEDKAKLESLWKDIASRGMVRNADVCFGEAVALNWEAPADGSAQVKVQLSPFGDFVLHDGGKMNGTVQHCTREAFEALVANWKASGSPEVLVDVDHASATGGSTEAAAWARNLRVEDEGLCADFELTPRGRELVEGRSYRFVSPGWTLSKDGTPLALCSVALTNRPNLPVKPVVNNNLPDSPENPGNPETTKKGDPEMDIKKLAAALGLPETATEEDVLAAIKAMQDREAQAAAEAANAKADEFADNAVKAGKIAANSKEAVKAAYLKDPEIAEAMLNSVAAPAKPAAQLPDFRTAKTPTALNARTPGKDADCVEVYNAYVAMPEGAEKDAYLAANAQAISDGYEKAHK